MRSIVPVLSILCILAYAEENPLHHYELPGGFIITNQPDSAQPVQKEEPFLFSLSPAEDAAGIDPLVEFDEEGFINMRPLLSDSEKKEEEVAQPADDEYGLILFNEDSDSSKTPQAKQERARKAPCFPYRTHAAHVGVRHSEANGVGYEVGYTTVEGFGIYHCNPCFMPFLDVRGHVFNNGKLAGNVGIGERTILSPIDHIFGLYCYYDVRQDQHHLTVNQISPGIELLGKRMEYRMNGYFPVGKHKSSHYGFEFDRFIGNQIRLKSKQRSALTGGDAEIGAHITQSTCYDLYAGAGPYYFSAEHASSWGGKARLLGRYKEYISLEATYSYDHLFGNTFQGSIGFSYPFGPKLKSKSKCCPHQKNLMISRAAFAPYRFEIPVVKKVTQRSKAINPATGEPWQVWFVNNLSHSQGTFESPFNTLLAAQNSSGPNDIIYVFPGDGTDTGMNRGIALQNGQHLFGSSIPHPIATTKGEITIPAFSTLAPTLSNSASVVSPFSVITLANGNEVSGINVHVTIQGTIGIDGTAGISGATIANNLISGSLAHSAMEISGSGNLLVANNHCTGPTQSLNFNGIELDLIGSSANVTCSNNVCSGYFDSIVITLADSSSILISGNAVSNFSNIGIGIFEGSPNSQTQIIANTVNNNTGIAGISVILGNNIVADEGTYSIKNNTVISTTSNISFGILGEMLSMNALAQIIIGNNNIQTGTAVDSSGILIDVAPFKNALALSLFGNQVTVPAPSSTTGLSLTSAGTSVINIDNFSHNVAPSIDLTGNINLRCFEVGRSHL